MAPTRPQHHSSPPETRAHVDSYEASRSIAMPPSPVACTGALLLNLPVTPSWLAWLSPQHHTAPSSVRAQVWLPPAATCATRLPRATTCTGAARLIPVPSPSSPD